MDPWRTREQGYRAAIMLLQVRLDRENLLTAVSGGLPLAEALRAREIPVTAAKESAPLNAAVLRFDLQELVNQLGHLLNLVAAQGGTRSAEHPAGAQ